MGRGALLAANLPQLQNLIKRDPAGYREEFLQQYNHYNSVRQLFLLSPHDNAARFGELVSFIAQVAVCYPTDTADFPARLAALLRDSYGALAPDTRKTLLHNLVILRNKRVISSIECAPFSSPPPP
jgi:protein SDA1